MTNPVPTTDRSHEYWLDYLASALRELHATYEAVDAAAAMATALDTFRERLANRMLDAVQELTLELHRVWPAKMGRIENWIDHTSGQPYPPITRWLD